MNVVRRELQRFEVAESIGPEFETGLRNRGSLTVWLCKDELKGWEPRCTKRKAGGQRKYTDQAIETALTIGMIYRQPLRQTEGFLRSLFVLLNVNAPVPDHTTLSRRSKKLGKLPISARGLSKPIHVIVDSSGLKVHVGKLRKPPKNRDWRKLHIGVDSLTGQIVASDLTSKSARDPARVLALLKQVERPIASATADAAYDTEDVYETFENHRDDRQPRVVIPPQKDAKLRPRSEARQAEVAGQVRLQQTRSRRMYVLKIQTNPWSRVAVKKPGGWNRESAVGF